MSLGFSEVIRSIETELAEKYLPGAIAWIDENRNNAWSNAIDKFDRALIACIARSDFYSAKAAGEHYTVTILNLIAEYKRHKGMDDKDSFLSSLGASA
jgi:hypothetical protein